MSKANSDIREKAKSKNILFWQIADKLGITDGNFSRKLRKELSAEEKKRFLQSLMSYPLKKNKKRVY